MRESGRPESGRTGSEKSGSGKPGRGTPKTSRDGKGTVNASVMKFDSISKSDLPRGRNGKHTTIIWQLLGDLQLLEEGQALKIPLADLPDSKENIRSALNRATRQRGMEVATSSDDLYLYVWFNTKSSGS